MKYIFFIIGDPGSREGTQCARLLSPSLVYISIGDLLRKEVLCNFEIKIIINQVLLVTSEISIEFHRQYEQTLLFEERLRQHNIEILSVIYFE